MNNLPSLPYVASHPPLVSIDGALSDTATVPGVSWNSEQLIGVPRDRRYYFLPVPGVENTVAFFGEM